MVLPSICTHNMHILKSLFLLTSYIFNAAILNRWQFQVALIRVSFTYDTFVQGGNKLDEVGY